MSDEKLNAQTDPAGLIRALDAAHDGRPYLGDFAMVDGLLRQFVAQVLERYDEVGHGVLTPDDAANADRAACFALASILHGDDPAYAPVGGWTGTPLALHLRERMALEVSGDDDERGVIAQALGVLVHKIYDLLREADAAPEAATQEQAAAAVKSMTMALVGVVGND